MKRSEVKEILAKTLHDNNGGLSSGAYLIVTGKKRREWRIDGIPWDSDPQNQLCEWERDDYREQAEAALRCLEELGMQPPLRMVESKTHTELIPFVTVEHPLISLKNEWEPEDESP